MNLKGFFLFTILVSLLPIFAAIAGPTSLHDSLASGPVNYDSTHYSIEGTVFDENGDAIPGALIKLMELNSCTVSNVDGNYKVLDIPAGIYVLSAGVVGYFRKSINRLVIPQNSAESINFTLLPIPLLQDGLLENPLPPLSKYLTSNYWKRNIYDLEHAPAKTVNLALRACPGISR